VFAIEPTLTVDRQPDDDFGRAVAVAPEEETAPGESHYSQEPSAPPTAPRRSLSSAETPDGGDDHDESGLANNLFVSPTDMPEAMNRIPLS
jgi:hypothetical protein